MQPALQKIIFGDLAPFATNGLKKYLSDHTHTFDPYFAEELTDVGKLLRTHGPVPVVVTDTFIHEYKTTCIRRLKAAVPGLKVIVVAEDFFPGVRQLHNLGADALLSKKSGFAELKGLVFKMPDSNEPLTCSRFKQTFAGGSHVIETDEHRLSEKENELVLMTIEKAGDKAIAAKQCIEPNTVSKNRRKIIDKITKEWGYKNLADYVEKKRLLAERY